MGLFSLLLRVLLCVTLIANGIGFAQASARAQLAHASHGLHAGAARSTAASPAERVIADAGEQCHAGMTMASHEGAVSHAVDHVGMGHGSDGGVEDGVQPAGAMDCCDGNNCRCACTQQASAAFIALLAADEAPAHSAVVLSGASQHASPRLANLIRPPIG